MNLTEADIVRFWSKVRKTRSCWKWVAGLVHGYGNFSVNQRSRRAHRVSWLIEHGSIPGDLCVLHTCDVRCCVRPSHLFLGTHKDNSADAARKNRLASVLSPHKVKYIRRLLQQEITTQAAIARHFGVSRQSVWNILHGHTWSHVQ